jgi:hypothetical protein
MEQTRRHHAAQSRTARDRIVDREVAKLETRQAAHRALEGLLGSRPHSSAGSDSGE